MNEELTQKGALNRLPADLSYLITRGFQTHDFLHILTGYRATHMGELALAAYYWRSCVSPITPCVWRLRRRIMRFEPRIITECMDAIADGWTFGRKSKNIHFHKWEEEIDTPLLELRNRFDLNTIAWRANAMLIRFTFCEYCRRRERICRPSPHPTKHHPSRHGWSMSSCAVACQCRHQNL